MRDQEVILLSLSLSLSLGTAVCLVVGEAALEFADDPLVRLAQLRGGQGEQAVFNGIGFSCKGYPPNFSGGGLRNAGHEPAWEDACGKTPGHGCYDMLKIAETQ